MVVIIVVIITDNLEILWQDDRGEEFLTKIKLNNKVINIKDNQYIIHCLYCNKEFERSHHVPSQHFCSIKCKRKYYKEHPKIIKLKCDNCGIEFDRNNNQQRKYENTFCSLECEKEFKYKETHETRECIICKKEFECLKTSKVQMCSLQCQGKWQSINLTGENANNFNSDFSIQDRTKYCEWCGKEFLVKPFMIDKAKFCSDDCRQEWYSHICTQTDEWKENARERAVNLLESGKFKNTNTGIQKKINKLLNSMNIKYINEKGFKNFAVDNYLQEYNLIIEVMGTYWHCDSRTYPYINYENQVHRIKMDKIKHTYFVNNYNIHILYLWEHDINNNLEMCKQLKTINNIIPYMDWDINLLKNIIDIQVKEKMSHKQQDKWITFKCECCGKEREELIAHYKKHKHHYCSRACAQKGSIKKQSPPV